MRTPHRNEASNIRAVARLLRDRYRDPRHYNKTNPLHELLFILLSVQTSENSYRSAYRSIRRAFPKSEDILAASRIEIATAIRDAGLSSQRARAIIEIYRVLGRRFGYPTLAPLKRMSEQDAEEFLTSLPRVGTKVARCVLMYSLGKKVFPVDTHVWRISRRIGWIRATASDGSCRKYDMDRLQEMIPPKLRYSLHVNLVALGREVCLPAHPKCAVCPINKYCRRVGVRSKKSRHSTIIQVQHPRGS
jgi:endonuclease III